jgi:hypothetical protein
MSFLVWVICCNAIQREPFVPKSLDRHGELVDREHPVIHSLGVLIMISMAPFAIGAGVLGILDGVIYHLRRRR